MLGDPDTLTRHLERGIQPITRAGDAAGELRDELATFAKGLSSSHRSALDVLLQRAFTPLASLLSHPLDELFDAESAGWLAGRQASNHRPHQPDLLPQPNGELSYHGYVSVIVKFTRLCNLRCAYCDDWREGEGQTMPFPVQAALFEKLLGSPNHGVIDIVWHGGEPTLLGQLGFLRILALQQWFRAPGQTLTNQLQTNATNLDDSWARLLGRYGFKVGVSIDGPSLSHDRNRRFANGRPSLTAVRRGLAAARRHGVVPGAVLVVDTKTLEVGAEAVLEFLRDEGIASLSMARIRPGSGGPEAEGLHVSSAAYAQFLLDFHRACKQVPDPWPRVREIDTARSALAGEVPRFCEKRGSCGGAFFAIEPDGRVSPCDLYGEDPDFLVGHILKQDFDEIRATTRMRELIRDDARSAADYAGCSYFEFCRGGCSYERYARARGGETGDGSCCGLAPLFEGLRSAESPGERS
jgi:uncharacterized protein